jgi:hypothetical protein
VRDPLVAQRRDETVREKRARVDDPRAARERAERSGDEFEHVARREHRQERVAGCRAPDREERLEIGEDVAVRQLDRPRTRGAAGSEDEQREIVTAHGTRRVGVVGRSEQFADGERAPESDVDGAVGDDRVRVGERGDRADAFGVESRQERHGDESRVEHGEECRRPLRPRRDGQEHAVAVRETRRAQSSRAGKGGEAQCLVRQRAAAGRARARERDLRSESRRRRADDVG